MLNPLKPNDLYLHHVEILIEDDQFHRVWNRKNEKLNEWHEPTKKIIQISQITQSGDTPDSLKCLASEENIKMLSALGANLDIDKMFNDFECIFRAEGILKSLGADSQLSSFGKITPHGGLLYFNDRAKEDNKSSIRGPMASCLSSTLFGDREIFHGFAVFRGAQGKFFCIDYNSLNLKEKSQDTLGIHIQSTDQDLKLNEKASYPYMQVMVADSEEDLTRLICARYGAYRFRIVDPAYKGLHSPQQAHMVGHELGECLDFDTKSHDLVKQGLNVHQVNISDIRSEEKNVIKNK